MMLSMEFLLASGIGMVTATGIYQLALRSRHESGSDHVDGHEPRGSKAQAESDKSAEAG